MSDREIELIRKIEELELKIKVDKERYKLIANYGNCGLWEYDMKTKVLFQSKKLDGRYSEMNLTINDYQNTVYSWGIIHPEDLPIFDEYCASMDKGEDSFFYEIRIMADGDDYIWARFEGVTIFDENNLPIKIVGKTLDVTSDKRERETLLEKTKKDTLTGLLNKTASRDAIIKCISRYEFNEYTRLNGNEEVHGLYIIDIDNFKQVNDVYGHLYGDYVIETIATILKEIFFTTDVIGRIGGDEFIVLKKGLTNKKEALITAEMLLDAVRANQLEKGNLITISIGICSFPEDGTTYEEIFSKADIALYEAKREGKNSYHCYDPNETYSNYSGETSLKSFLQKDENESAISKDSYFERRLLDFALRMLYDSSDGYKMIQTILSETGKYYEFEKIVVLEWLSASEQISIVEKWSKNNGIKSPQDEKRYWDAGESVLKGIESRMVGTGYAILDENSHIEMLENDYLQTEKEQYSCLQCSIVENGDFVGYIGYVKTNNKIWTLEEIKLFTLVTNMISSNILKIRNKEELKRENFYNQEVLKNQKLANYVVSENTYEVKYAGDFRGSIFSNMVVGKICYELLGLDKPCNTCPIQYLKNAEDPSLNSFSLEYYNENKEAWISSTVTKIVQPEEENVYLICDSDVTSFMERVRSTDSLTGLMSLEKFEAEAMRMIARRDHKDYAIVYIGFKRFNHINEEWGYVVGDRVLRIFADRMSVMLEEDELIARIMSDNFLLMVKYEEKNVKRCLDRIDTALKTASIHFSDAYPNINAFLVGGIYLMRPHEYSVVQGIDNANIARKSIANYGNFRTNDIILYDESMKSRISLQNRIEHLMFDSLLNKEFIPYIQPMINLETGKIYGGEVLSRWFREDRMISRPDEFIPIFEENGFIKELDFYMYNMIFSQMRVWMDAGLKVPVIAINISRIHFVDHTFIGRFTKLVRRYRIAPEQVELELTENMFLDNLDRLLGVIDELRKKGFQISIDDFGSGYSSLNLIKVLPVDVLKLDGGFFKQNEMQNKDKKIISNLIQLAHDINLKTVCEGVETKEQVEFIKECKGDIAQGYYFYKPITLEEFEVLLKENR